MVIVSYRLAVDLGTTFTAAAVVEDGPPTLLGLGNRAMQVPSALYVELDGTILVGEAAERRESSDPGGLVPELKRRIGDPVRIFVSGQSFQAEDLAAEWLRWVVARARQRMGSSAEQVVVTHPASWGPHKLGQMARITASAQVASPSLMPEPSAAAAQYASRSAMATGDRIAVYDLGGGTFDTCVLIKTAEGFEVLGEPRGVEHLGGIDFDAAIFEHVVAKLGGLSDIDPDAEDVVLGLKRLRRECVEAKEALSEDEETALSLMIPGVRRSVRLTRSEVELLVQPWLSDTHAALRKAMRSASVDPKDLSSLVLVGGSSRMPIVRQLLTEEFGLPTALDTHPKHDIALGALQPTARVAEHKLSATTKPTPASSASPFSPTAPTIASAPLPASTDGASQEPPPASTSPILTGGDSKDPGEGDSLLLGRRGMVAAIGFVAVAMIVTAVIVYVLIGDRTESSPSRAAATQRPETTTPSPTPATTSRPLDLPRGPALPRTEMVLVRTYDGGAKKEIWAADTDEYKVLRQVTPTNKYAESPVLSPDRRTLVYLATKKDTLRVVGVDGDGDRRLLDDPSICPAPQRGAWDLKDDGRRLVLACGELGDQKLMIVDADGANPRQLVSGPSVRSPSISPDGNWVVYCQAELPEDCNRIWRVNTKGSPDPHPLTSDDQYDDAGPAWSPNGAQIVFKRSHLGHSDIWVMESNGDDPIQLTADEMEHYAPSWSPDGKRIAYVSSDRPKVHPHIYVMGLKDKVPVRIQSELPGIHDLPTWARR